MYNTRLGMVAEFVQETIRLFRPSLSSIAKIISKPIKDIEKV
jgi:hypothetical protein